MDEGLDHMLERWAKLKEKRDRYRELLHRFKGEVARLLGREVKVLVFGSIVEGRERASSDVDVMVIAEEFSSLNMRLKAYSIARRIFGIPNPFELHLITPEEFENWYRRFISKYEEIS